MYNYILYIYIYYIYIQMHIPMYKHMYIMTDTF